MTIAAIHQPGYFPWIGVIEKIARADTFVVLDNVQFNRAAYQHRTLYSASGGAKLLTLPVKKAGFLETGLRICDVELADARAPSKHFETLKGRYRKSPGWPALETQIMNILSIHSTKLLDYALETLRLTLRAFGIERRIVLASELGCCGAKSDLVLNLVRAVGCDTYLSGTGARAYQTPEHFEQANIRLLYQNLQHPHWQQSHGGHFQPGTFALEWILEEGKAAQDAFDRHLVETAANAFLAPGQVPTESGGLP
jgi:hypothetical protein